MVVNCCQYLLTILSESFAFEFFNKCRDVLRIGIVFIGSWKKLTIILVQFSSETLKAIGYGFIF